MLCRTILLQQQEIGPLTGVVIAVSKKLSAQQADYNNIISGLGGDYRWTYDKSCTHFIYQVSTFCTVKCIHVYLGRIWIWHIIGDLTKNMNTTILNVKILFIELPVNWIFKPPNFKDTIEELHFAASYFVGLEYFSVFKVLVSD